MENVVLKSRANNPLTSAVLAEGQRDYRIRIKDGRILDVTAWSEHEAFEKIDWAMRQGIIEAWNDWSI